MTRGEVAWGLSASLAAHLALGAALVLAAPAAGPARARGSRPVAITRMRLVPPGAPGGGAAAVERSSPVRRAERRPRAAARGARLEAPASAPPAVGAVTAAAPSVAEIAEGVGAEGAGGESAPAEAGSAAGTGTGVEGGGSTALAELASRLGDAARGCYPAAARRLRLRGEVGVVFCVGEGGLASSVRVERSSGSALLDGAASSCVVPGALPSPGASGCFSLPVRFGAGD
jgi:protein TonB